jgi:hypothetical protein
MTDTSSSLGDQSHDTDVHLARPFSQLSDGTSYSEQVSPNDGNVPCMI